VDQNCLCYEGSRCLKCAHRYYLNTNRCIAIPTECLSYDILSGVCNSCVPGYLLANGLCEPERPSVYYSGSQCFSCFSGYKMVNNQCVYSPTDLVSP
jgi:hypothetical protein